MRILYLISQFLPESQSDTARVCLNLARGAQRSGHYVHVLACTLQPERLANARPATALPRCWRATYHGVPVTFMPRTMLPDSADYGLDPDREVAGALAAWIAAEGFGIVHVMHPQRNASALLAIQQSAIPYVITLTDFFVSCFRGNLSNVSAKPCAGAERGQRCARDCLVAPWTAAALARRFQQATSVLVGAAARICPSEFVADQFRSDFPELTFSVIAHGIDLLALCEGAGVAARAHGIVQLGYVGPLITAMGVDLLLGAFARLPNRPMRLKICGLDECDEVYLREMRRLAEADTRVELLGPVPIADVYEIIGSVDAICIPSRFPESFSRVLHEAAAAGVPAIVSALGEPGQFVRTHGSGLVVATNEVDSWVATLKHVADNPSVLKDCTERVPLPSRVEEESFFYESIYRQHHLN